MFSYRIWRRDVKIFFCIFKEFCRMKDKMKMIGLGGSVLLLAFCLGNDCFGGESLVVAMAGQGKGEVKSKSRQRQLFIDDYMVEKIEGLERVVNKAEKYPGNPVITPDTPWESRCEVYGTALFDEKKQIFRIWYLTMPETAKVNEPMRFPDGRLRAGNTTICAYAESKDGIHWVKPNLKQFPYYGDTNNNLIDIGLWNCEGISVIEDENETNPQRRFKAVYWDHGELKMVDGKLIPSHKAPKDGFCVAFSPDGLRWTPYQGNPVIAKYCDTNQNVLYDEKLGKYVAYSRFGFSRRLARSESDDFMHWSEPKIVLEIDTKQEPGCNIYGAGVNIYEGLYLATLWVYRQGIDGKIDTQLISSRDGINWQRLGNRATWLELGEPGSWESGMVRATEGIITRGDKLYIYYNGVDVRHPGPMVKEKTPVNFRNEIGLVIIRRDGFVSLDAGEKQGYVLTKPFVLPHGRLYLNTNAAGGQVSVEITDENGKTIKGFEKSKPITGDKPAAVVKWKSRKLTGIAGRKVRLRIYGRNCKLYSYWFE